MVSELNEKLAAQEEKLASVTAASSNQFGMVHNPLKYTYHYSVSNRHDDSANLATICGWPHGKRPHRRLKSIPEGTNFRNVCERCLPLLRSQLKTIEIESLVEEHSGTVVEEHSETMSESE